MSTVSGQLLQQRPLSSSVTQIILQLDLPLMYQAGQYIQVEPKQLDSAFFTVANAPAVAPYALPGHLSTAPNLIELHIQQDTANKIIDLAQRQAQRLNLCGPYGSCHVGQLQFDCSALVLIGSGTGYAQLKAFTEWLIQQGNQRPTYLYWGARTSAELYLLEQPRRWAQQYDWLHVCAHSSEQPNKGNHHQLLQAAIFNDFEDMAGCEALCCGSIVLVQALCTALHQRGVKFEHLYSDCPILPKDWKQRAGHEV